VAPQHPDEPSAPAQEPAAPPFAPAQDEETAAAEAGEAGEGGEGGAHCAAERSAQRAAAFAATEGFHPLRLRPYVGEPGDAGESTVRPVHDAAEGDGPAPGDLGLFTEAYAGYEYADDDPAALEDLEGPEDEEAAAAARRGRHRRRRRGIVVAAAAVAASALAAGAVAVTGQVINEQGAAGHALPDLASSTVPDVTLPPDAGPATAKVAPAAQETGRARTPVRAATPSTSAPASPAPTTGSPQPTASADGTIAPTTAGTPAPPASASPPPSGQPASPATVQVLQLGDSGPAVEDLQRRLAEVWVYHGRIDGVFDKQVQHAVATFQVWYWVSDAPDGSHDGVYGPNTRAALERQTSGR